MRTPILICLVHFLATVGGWYALGGFAQGVVDGATLVPPPLVVLNEIIEILLFPLVTAVLWIFPGTGGYSLGSFVSFAAAALVNSAIFATVVTSVSRAIRRRQAAR
jgi:hypothetical protein